MTSSLLASIFVEIKLRLSFKRGTLLTDVGSSVNRTIMFE